jgi:hypothetical protein
MSWYRPGLERIGQLAFIVMCVVVSAVGIQRLRASPSPAAARPAPMEPGMKVELHKALRSERARGSLVLALSTNCQYCTASMPFYGTLAALDVVRDGRIHLSAVSLQPEEQMRAYLDTHAVPVPSVVLFRDSGLVIQGTPTLVLVDRSGTVVNSWSGQLRPAEEEALVREVRTLAAR